MKNDSQEIEKLHKGLQYIIEYLKEFEEKLDNIEADVKEIKEEFSYPNEKMIKGVEEIPKIKEAIKNNKKQRMLNNKAIRLLTELFPLLPQITKYKLVVVDYLHEKHPNLKVSINSLSVGKLKPSLRQEGRDYLRAILGNRIDAENIIKEVFR